MSWVMAAVASAFFAGITSIVRPFRNRFRCRHGAAYFGGTGVCVGYGCRGGFGPYYRSDNSAVLVIPCSFWFGDGRFVDQRVCSGICFVAHGGKRACWRERLPCACGGSHEQWRDYAHRVQPASFCRYLRHRGCLSCLWFPYLRLFCMI